MGSKESAAVNYSTIKQKTMLIKTDSEKAIGGVSP